MPEYRRAFVPGGTFFLTIVTHHRAPVFRSQPNVGRLRRAVAILKRERPVDVLAAVIMPDHIHFIWELPPNDHDFSKRVGRLKVLFTRSLRPGTNVRRADSASRSTHREASIWQRRFWEHTIRDEHDFRRHLDYIHYNPVKHGLATCAHSWPYSSFERWTRRGVYEPDWFCTCLGPLQSPPSFEDLRSTVGE